MNPLTIIITLENLQINGLPVSLHTKGLVIFNYRAVKSRHFKRCHDRRRRAQCLLHDTTTFSSILKLVYNLWVKTSTEGSASSGETDGSWVSVIISLYCSMSWGKTIKERPVVQKQLLKKFADLRWFVYNERVWKLYFTSDGTTMGLLDFTSMATGKKRCCTRRGLTVKHL